MHYNKYSTFLKEKYGEKVYKLPVHLEGTCPNRDGTKGKRGCVFCSEIGAGFEMLENHLPVKEQLLKNMAYIGEKYSANKFIAYFQNYTGTYMPLDRFKEVISEAVMDKVVGISISTRPDCITDAHLAFLKTLDVDIEIELGLQSINPNTLEKINRGHGLAEFISAVSAIKAYGFSICVHLIGNLPWDTEADFLEAGRVLSALGVDGVKVHSLYVLKDTVLGDWHQEKPLDLMTKEAYIDRVIQFLRELDPKITVQRLFGRAPEKDTLFCNWDTSWRKLQNTLDETMIEKGYRQGDLYRRSL